MKKKLTMVELQDLYVEYDRQIGALKGDQLLAETSLTRFECDAAELENRMIECAGQTQRQRDWLQRTGIRHRRVMKNIAFLRRRIGLIQMQQAWYKHQQRWIAGILKPIQQEAARTLAVMNGAKPAVATNADRAKRKSRQRARSAAAEAAKQPQKK